MLAAIGRVCADPRSHEVHRTHGAPVLADWVMLAAAPTGKVGRYRLVDVLGRGGFGVVYEAHDAELHRAVAIKALLAASDPVQAEALRHEARALAVCSHPNVVQIYDVVVAGGRVWLVMELVRGETLRDWQRAVVRPAAEILDRYLAAAQGLSAIHDAGLVHADFKPDNVLVSEDGRVRVSDFGLARAAVAASMGIAGTPRYMAPEQKAGAAIDARADQYAWCISLLEALGGAAPGERPIREVPPRVRAVLLRGRASEPSARWPCMRSLAAALRNARRTGAGRWVAASSIGVLATMLGVGIALDEPSEPSPPASEEAAPAASSPAAPQIAAEIEHAVKVRDSGDFLMAQVMLMPFVDGRVPASMPLRIRARQELARTLASMGLHDLAEEQWTTAHEMAVEHHADLLAAGISIDLARDGAEHIESAKEARVWLRTAEAELRRVEIDPAEHAPLALVDAMLIKTDGRMREAAEALERVAQLPDADDLTRVRVRLEWAGALGRVGQHELGLQKVAEGHTMCDVAGLGPSIERIELRRTAATLLQNLGRFDDAVKEMDLALAEAGEIAGLSSGHLSALHGDLGIFHLQLDHRDESGLHLQKAVELAPDSFAAHSNLSIHYSKLACKRDVEVPGCDPDAADLSYAHQLRALELARETYGEDHPTFATMRANVARELLDRGELERAQGELDHACTQLALHFGDEAHQLMNPLYGLVEVNVRLGRREAAMDAAERLHTVAHGAAFAQRKDAIAVLDYVVGRTLAWDGRPEGRAAELMASGRAYFGERPTDDFMLVDAWFRETVMPPEAPT